MLFFGAGGIVFLIVIAFWIWALFDCISTDAVLCRNLPKGFWVILVLLLPDLGALAWLLLGRPERAGWRPGSTDSSTPRRPMGIEDSPRYSAIAGVTDSRSAELDRRLEEWEEEQARQQAAEAASNAPMLRADLDAWESELAAREDDLRRRELELRERELDERDRRLDD